MEVPEEFTFDDFHMLKFVVVRGDIPSNYATGLYFPRDTAMGADIIKLMANKKVICDDLVCMLCYYNDVKALDTHFGGKLTEKALYLQQLAHDMSATKLEKLLVDLTFHC